MSGDLEDFLRRAAERRKQKQQQQQPAPQQQAPRQRPQYSNKRAERAPRPVPEDEVLTAELVDEEHPDSLVARQRRLEEAKKLAAEAKAKLAKQQRPRSTDSIPTAVATGGSTTDDLIELLRSPNGIKQAILLREILDRPQHRW